MNSGTSCPVGRHLNDGESRAQKWFFDKQSRQCKTFTYVGCGGNTNRFDDRATCETFCKGVVPLEEFGACPNGLEVFLTVGELLSWLCEFVRLFTTFWSKKFNELTFRTQGPPTMHPRIGELSCELLLHHVDHTEADLLQRDSLVSRRLGSVHSAWSVRFSCSLSARNVRIRTCSRSDTNGGTPTVAACQKSVAGTCPSGFTCTSSANVHSFALCCRPTAVDTRRRTTSAPRGKTRSCPSNLLSNGQSCSINAVNACPQEHVCLRPLGEGPSAAGLCCRASPSCLNSVSYIIPGKWDEFRYLFALWRETRVQFAGSVGRQPQVCGSGLSGCPSGYSCRSSSVPSISICCLGKQASSKAKCPGRRQPWISPGALEVGGTIRRTYVHRYI